MDYTVTASLDLPESIDQRNATTTLTDALRKLARGRSIRGVLFKIEDRNGTRVRLVRRLSNARHALKDGLPSVYACRVSIEIDVTTEGDAQAIRYALDDLFDQGLGTWYAHVDYRLALVPVS